MTLEQGSRGAEVTRLQILLNDKAVPGPRLRVDGDFGAKTYAAVVAFQAQRGLTADGIVGSSTWAELGQRPDPAPAPAASDDSDAPWYGIAQAELGVRENALPGQDNQRILEYHATTTLHATTDETAWCSSFVNWALIQAELSGTNSAAARSWLSWGRRLDDPRLGAITVIKRKNANHDAATGSTSGFHVGFHVSHTAAVQRLLGGNQSNAVRYSDFSLATWDLRGYFWP